jgi:small subunit ribosomal protein S2
MQETGDIYRLTKKEGLMITREIERLESRLGGVRNMKTLPDLLFIVDISREATAVHEANLRDIPVVAMVDTNCDPGQVDYVIPSNDDAIRAIKLIVGKLADAVLEGKAMMEKDGELAADEAEASGPIRPKRSVRTVREEEISDEDLLGAATLAKMTRAGEPADFEEEE